jgi:hypothetical protein
MNIGEELVMAYLQYIKGCEFVQQNLYTPDIQGEIDVVGIDIDNKTIYVCEVAIHLQTGLQYVNQIKHTPNNVNKLFAKFSKDIEYANKYFPDYKKIIMLWCPIVKNQKSGSKHNQMNDVAEVKNKIKTKYGIELETIINEKFMDCFKELREYAGTDKKENKSPVIRLLQIEEFLKKYLEKQ